MKITVTKKDIKAGLVRNNDKCPIALAIKRHKYTQRVSVAKTRVELFYNNTCFEADLPTKAVRFIHHFDSFKPVKPIQFQLEIKPI